MQLQNIIINKLNQAIRALLNKNNIVDFKNSDKTKLVSLDSFIVTIPNLKLEKKAKKGKLILFSNNRTSIKTSYFDENNLIFSANLESIFTNNNLEELINEYYNNNCAKIINFVNQQLSVHKEALSEPDTSKEFKDLLSDIQELATRTKNKRIQFFASQISDFQNRFAQLQDFEKKKINAFFEKQMIKESSNFVKILSRDSQIQKVVDTLVKKLSKFKSYNSALRDLHKYKIKPLVTTNLRIKDKVVSINFALCMDREEQAAALSGVDPVNIYINNVLEYGEINSELDLKECIETFLRDFESYKGEALRRIIGSLIVHEIQHKLNPQLFPVGRAKKKKDANGENKILVADKIKFREKRLDKIDDFKKFKEEHLNDPSLEPTEIQARKDHLTYLLDPTEIQARTAQLTYYLISRFETLPQYRRKLKNLPQIFAHIPSSLKHKVDEVDPKIRNKILREVYKYLKEKGYQ